MNKKWIGFIILGIILRIIFAYCMTYSGDFRILTLHFKSIATTGNLFESMHALLKVENNPQLYGKIWYQIWGIWLSFLSYIHIISLTDINLIKHIQPYQQFFIKLFQMVFDGLIFFFTFKIAKKLVIRRIGFVILFWAINPIWIYISYSMLQADVAMLSFLLVSTYLTLKYKGLNHLSIVLLALAFVTKMVPSLLFPVFLLYAYESNKKTVIHVIEFILFSIIISQPWSHDFLLMRQFGLASREVLGIFHEQWNGASVFVLMYAFFILFLWQRRKRLQSSSRLFITALTAIILIVYLGETNVLLFPQFMTWIMPFATILIADEIGLFPVLIAPFANFLSAAVINNSFLTGALSDLTGIKTKTAILPFFARHFNEKFLTVGLWTIFVGLSILFLFYCISEMNKKKFKFDTAYKAIAEKWGVSIIVIIYQLYYVFLLFDLFIQKAYK